MNKRNVAGLLCVSMIEGTRFAKERRAIFLFEFVSFLKVYLSSSRLHLFFFFVLLRFLIFFHMAAILRRPCQCFV